MELNADCKPYHWASYWARPLAMVSGSSKMAVSSQSRRVGRVAWPRKRERIEDVSVACIGERETPGARLRLEVEEEEAEAG